MGVCAFPIHEGPTYDFQLRHVIDNHYLLLQLLRVDDKHFFCYWYRTKVRTTVLSSSFVFAWFLLPPSPNFNVAWFWTAMSAGIFRTKVRTTKHTFFTTLKLGGRGVRYLQMRFRESRYMFPFRVPSWVVRTFVLHLSDSHTFVVSRSISKRFSLVPSASNFCCT